MTGKRGGDVGDGASVADTIDLDHAALYMESQQEL